MNTAEPDLSSRKTSLIFAASRKGWSISAEGDWGIQFSRPKVYREGFYWAGLGTLVLGIGVVVWLWGYMEYLSRRDQVYLVSNKDLLGDNRDAIFRRLNQP